MPLRLRQVAPGLDGLWALLLSNVILLGTAGLSLLPLWRQVRDTARDTGCDGVLAETAVILGYGLRRDEVLDEYHQRLERGRALLAAGAVERLLLVGGRCGDNRLSEAEAGRDFLLARGVPAAQILLEDRSRHTLENLHLARAQHALHQSPFVLISSRYHLARCDTLARGLSLQPLLCAAEQPGKPRHVSELREAYYLHWYHTGKHWSRLTRNRKSLARIS
jgi:uncharacterized SAM-binding protein YcdF (DUF218 family)